MKFALRILFLLSALFPSIVFAQQGDLRDVNILNFRPTNDPYGIFTTDSSARLNHLDWYVGGTLSYVNSPLTLALNGDNVADIVANQALLDLNVSMGLLKHFQIGLHFALVMYQNSSGDLSGFSDTSDIKSIGLGDVRVVPKWVILKRKPKGFGVALIPQFSIPLASSGSNAGDSFLNFEPRVVVDYKLGNGILIALNAGYRVREAVSVGNLHVNDEVYFSAGAQYPLNKKISLLGEIYGAAGVTDSPGDPDSGVDMEEVPLEAVAGGRYNHESGIIMTAGVGAGLTSGYGSPKFRVFVGVGYMPPKKKAAAPVVLDSDGDGIEDSKDKCPKEKEDIDNFKDTDGCPDLDNDNDGIPDDKDACPLKPENINGIKDNDGCPDVDEDRDKDGILNKLDKCPDDPEDKDGFKDSDGCPDADNDGDGFCDPNDTIQKKLKKYASVCKGKDACPLKKENVNGYKDNDGCPDKIVVKVKIDKNRILILDKVYFETSKAVIMEKSYKILNLVSNVLNKNLQITKIRIEGHTDSVGNARRNLRLSKRRARAVMKYLVNKGVDKKRLVSRGYGPKRPKVKKCKRIKNRTDRKACYSKNRRVEFKIVKMNKGGRK
jgi:large repetitive protein